MKTAGVRDKNERRPGRPYGAHYVRAIRVRFPPEVDSALRRLRRLSGVSVSQLVRMGMMRMFCDKVREAVAAIDDPATSERIQLEWIEFLRVCSEADLALHYPEVAAVLRESKRRLAEEARRERRAERMLAEHRTTPPGYGPSAAPDRARPAPMPADPGFDFWVKEVTRIRQSGVLSWPLP